jgi:hypothetical protein
MFDHSCGHDRQQQDELNVENTNKSFGRNQRKMRGTKIEQEKGYLGLTLGNFSQEMHKVWYSPQTIVAHFGCHLAIKKRHVMISF